MKSLLWFSDTRVGLGMGFFWDPESRSRRFGIEIFYSELDRNIQRIPNSQGSKSGFDNLKKIPKIPKSRGSRSGTWNWTPKNSRFFKSRDYPRDFRKIPGVHAKSPGFRIFRDFLPFRGMGYTDRKPPLLRNDKMLEITRLPVIYVAILKQTG